MLQCAPAFFPEIIVFISILKLLWLRWSLRISMNLDANVRIKVNDAVVKQVDRFVYLGNEL
jgi:hypothetical protein